MPWCLEVSTALASATATPHTSDVSTGRWEGRAVAVYSSQRHVCAYGQAAAIEVEDTDGAGKVDLVVEQGEHTGAGINAGFAKHPF